MMDGRTEMPAFSKAMTKGLACAVPLELPKLGSLYGLVSCQSKYSSKNIRQDSHTKRPTMNILIT